MIGLELVRAAHARPRARRASLPLARLVDALTRAPARIVGLAGAALARGRARRASRSSIPSARWTVAPERLRSKSKNTPFLGQTVKGMVMMTLVARCDRLRRARMTA